MAYSTLSPGQTVSWVLLMLVLWTLMPTVGMAQSEDRPTKYWAYIGTYTRGSKSDGIYRLEFDAKTGNLSDPVLAGKTDNPSFLAIDPSHKFMYACGEIADFNGKKSGAVVSFSIDPQSGDLKELNKQPSNGAAPCHLVVDKTGKFVLCANYTGGNACVHPILKNGRLGKMSGFAQHKGGSNADPRRQKGPHAHSINLDKANNFAFVADLGLDQVVIYRFDNKKGTITPNDPPFAKVPPGSGPRHFSFHPNGKFAYAINELGNTVSVMKYNADKGELTPIQNITTLPEDFKKTSHTAEVVVHPSGKFLYGSNRGHNSIAMFKVNSRTGKLTSLGQQAKGIDTPRNFNIDPTGKWLIVCNQGSDDIVVFRINQKTGNLEPTDVRAEVSRPVCVRFMAIPGN